jgi:FkbM family methyltransferase
MDNDVGKEGFFARNKVVSLAIILACLVFVAMFFLEKSKSVARITTKLRGEVALGNGLVILATEDAHPMIIKKDDSSSIEQLRMSGSIVSKFTEVLEQLCALGNNVVEVGAHFGYRTMKMGSKLVASGKLYAFEPNRSIFPHLRKNIILNDLENTVILKMMAISGHKGKCQLENTSTPTVTDIGYDGNSQISSVDCNTLDAEMESIAAPIDLLAIGTSGMEFDIIAGAEGIIRRSPNIIIVMCLEGSNRLENAEKKLQKLSQQGFKFYSYGTDRQILAMDVKNIRSEKDVILIISRKALGAEINDQ